jgi:hypothetical protein
MPLTVGNDSASHPGGTVPPHSRPGERGMCSGAGKTVQ